MQFTSGARFDHFEIISLLGAGGMGEVHLAEDIRLRRKVALKFLPEQFTKDPDRVRRFMREARAASALNHPNILTVYEIGEVDGTHYIATEYIEGETLRQQMEEGKLSLNSILDTASQVASALAGAHEAGIVHRDIKPENIMTRRDGYIKVLDFGLAKLTEQEPSKAEYETQTSLGEARTMLNRIDTDPGMVIGTVGYMSPEQVRGVKVDSQTDIFSLGVVLYEMIANRSPFPGATNADVLAAILEREPKRLSDHAPDTPREVISIVDKALRKDRTERYPSAKDLLTDLKAVKRRLEFDAEPRRLTNSEDRARDGAAADYETSRQAVRTDESQIGRKTSKIERRTGTIGRHRVGIGILLAVLLLAGSAYLYYVMFPGKQITSIAVLPFANTSKDPNTEYLSDGISESLINYLSQLNQLKVIARSSSARFKGKEGDPQAVAKALSVQAILTGKVTQRGDRLIINAELVDTRDSRQLWGEQYDQQVTDLLAVQAAIAKEIAAKLSLRLTGAEALRLARRETVNPAAYELVLQGRFYARKSTNESRAKALECYNQAIAADPNYALAYTYLANLYIVLAGASSADPRKVMPQAEAAAKRALDLDPNLADAHLVLATLRQNGWEWAEAEGQYKKALELNPNYAAAHNGYSSYLSAFGRHDEAIKEVKRARELDPLSLARNANVGNVLFLARRYDDAIEDLKRTVELDRTFPLSHAYLGYVFAAKGLYPNAITEYLESLKLGGESTSTGIYLGYAYAKAGQREKAEEILKQMQQTKEYVSPAELAILHLGLGDREQALQSLEQAYGARDLQMQLLPNDPHYDGLRGEPRFETILQKVGLRRTR